MKQKGPFSMISNWIFLPGAERKRGVSVKRGLGPGLQTGVNAVNEVGSWRRVMGYEVLGFCLRKSALVDKLRGMPIPPG